MTSASEKTMFPTLVVGSLPRPQWVRDLVDDRKGGRIGDQEADGLLDDAIPSAVHMQERAGLDYVSDGEWRRESYVKVFADAVDGFEADLIKIVSPRDSGLTYPAVTGPMSRRRPIVTAEAAFLLKQTDRKVIVAVPSPYTIGRRMWSPDHSTAAYVTREEFMEACIPIVRDEIKELAAMGVDAVQLDDPWLALLVDPDYRQREGITDVDHEIEMSVKCVNGATAGIEDVFLSVHMCHAHFNRRHATRGSYELIIEALGDMNVDRLAMEFATPDAGGVESLRGFPTSKTLGLGVLDHTDTRVETPEEVVARVEAAMEYLPRERITLNPDCGFSPSSVNPMDFDEAYLKLAAMCRGAELLRERYG